MRAEYYDGLMRMFRETVKTRGRRRRQLPARSLAVLEVDQESVIWPKNPKIVLRLECRHHRNCRSRAMWPTPQPALHHPSPGSEAVTGGPFDLPSITTLADPTSRPIYMTCHGGQRPAMSLQPNKYPIAVTHMRKQ